MVDRFHDADQLADALASLAPALAAKAGDTPAALADTFAIIRAAGLCGIEDPMLRQQAARGVGRLCASAAWLLSEAGTAAEHLQGFSSPARAAVAEGPVLAAGSGAGRAVRSAEGWTVWGNWPSVGGSGLADWIMLPGIIGDEGTPMIALVRMQAVEARPYAYLGGLRGLDWHHVVLDAVPLAEPFLVAEAGCRSPGGSLARQLGALLGCAEGGRDDYMAMTRKRIAGIGGAAVASFTQVQSRLAESDAELVSAGLLFDRLVARDAQAAVQDAQRLRDQAFIARKALDAVTRLVRQMGAMGLAESNPVQRRYRDVRMLAADPAFAWDGNMAGYGRHLLGIETPAAEAA